MPFLLPPGVQQPALASVDGDGEDAADEGPDSAYARGGRDAHGSGLVRRLGHTVILFLPGSLRSLWSPVVVLIGVTFFLVGVGVLVESSSDIASVVIGLVGAGGGLAMAWRGVRMGVFRTEQGLVVRELLGSDRYAAHELRGIGVAETPHDSAPLMTVLPVLRKPDEDVPVQCLSTYRFLPGSVRRAERAAETMARWTGTEPTGPVVDE